MEQQVRGVLVRTAEGDITRMETDAIVNAANNHFWMGSGVAGAIKRVGGSQIEAEAIDQGPVAVGMSVVTDGGQLAARHVIHAAVMGQDLRTSAQAIRNATWSALTLAEELNLRSVALPAFGTGVGGFSPAGSARAMVGATLDFVRHRGSLSLKEIILVLFSSELTSVFDEALASAAGEE